MKQWTSKFWIQLWHYVQRTLTLNNNNNDSNTQTAVFLNEIQLCLLLDSWRALPLFCYSNRPAIFSQKLLALILGKIIQTKSLGGEQAGTERVWK